MRLLQAARILTLNIMRGEHQTRQSEPVCGVKNRDKPLEDALRSPTGINNTQCAKSGAMKKKHAGRNQDWVEKQKQTRRHLKDVYQ